jgi:hypothetical protein
MTSAAAGYIHTPFSCRPYIHGNTKFRKQSHTSMMFRVMLLISCFPIRFMGGVRTCDHHDIRTKLADQASIATSNKLKLSRHSSTALPRLSVINAACRDV